MMNPIHKGKRRVKNLTFLNANKLWLMQIFERNCFKRWITVAMTSDKDYAIAWAREKE